MYTQTVDTAVSGIVYPVTIQQFSDMDEVRGHFEALGENADEAILKVVNTYQDAQAKQGGKEGPRKLLRGGADPGSEEVLAAIAKHQEHAGSFVIGVPRTTVGGVTKAKRTYLGTEVVKFSTEQGRLPNPEELSELAATLGFSL